MEATKAINFYGSKIYRYKVYNGKNLVFQIVLPRPPEDVMPELKERVYWVNFTKARVYCNDSYVGFIACNNER